MKRLGMLLMACAIVLGMSQCKKEETPSVNNNEKIFVTFSANSNQGNTKTEFNPSYYNKFVWSSGVEYVNVGGSVSGYLGQLSGDGHNTLDDETHREFSGSITAPQDGETLYFFYLGKGDHAGATSIDFADQTGVLADVTNKHIAIGSWEYHEGQDHFEAILYMAMAIACFNTVGFVDGGSNPETVYLYGEDIYSSASINYSDGTISGSAKNYICAGEANAACYVALIPDDDDTNNLGSTQINFVSKSHAGSIYFDGIIAPREFYAHTVGEPGLEVAIQPSEPGFIPYAFSVSPTKKVRFAKGNLQYMPSTSTWRFAEHQYDVCVDMKNLTYWMQPTDGEWGKVEAATYHYWLYEYDGVLNDLYDGWYVEYDATSQYQASGTSWIDLFGWGTWGPGMTPYLTSSNNSDYQWSDDFSGTLDGHNDWYTLAGGETGEWYYLFNTRNNAANLYGYGTVAGMTGLIILPDVFTDPFTNGGSASFVPQNVEVGYNANIYTAEGWALMESAGAVFLPAAGYRAEEAGPIVSDPGDWGIYWSKTNYNSTHASAMGIIEGSGLWLDKGWDEAQHQIGGSVRLVRDVE